MLAILFSLILGTIAWADAPVTALAIAPDGQQYVAGSQAGLSVCRLTDQVSIATIATSLPHVHDFAFSPNGQYLLAVGGAPAEAGQVELYAWPKLELLQRMKVSDDLLTRAAWSSDSTWFATSGHDGRCYLNKVNGASITQYPGHSRSVLALLVQPQDRHIISAGVDTTIQIWTADAQRQRTLNNHTASVTDLAWNSNANNLLLVSSSEDRTVRLWQPQIGRMIKFVRLPSTPRRVAWHPSNQLVAAGDDGMVVQIDPDEMQVTNTLKSKVQPIFELALTDGKIVIAGEGGIEVLNLKVKR